MIHFQVKWLPVPLLNLESNLQISNITEQSNQGAIFKKSIDVLT